MKSKVLVKLMVLLAASAMVLILYTAKESANYGLGGLFAGNGISIDSVFDAYGDRVSVPASDGFYHSGLKGIARWLFGMEGRGRMHSTTNGTHVQAALGGVPFYPFI